MRDLELVDAVITLHEIAGIIARLDHGLAKNLSDDIRNCANRVHVLSIEQGRASNVADEIIKQAKE
jgi:hypothetical protein